MSPHPLAFAMDGLAATCDARDWHVVVSYTPGAGWYADLFDELEGRITGRPGATMPEALTDLWTATQRHCRELAATGPARRAGEA